MKQYGWLLTKIYSLMMISYKDTFVTNYIKDKVDNTKTILEIGSGTGKDFKTLSEIYNITGSDYSDAFLKLLRKKYKESEFLKINVVKIETEKKYNVIFSNKVLQHLTPDQLEASLKSQYETLNDNGIVIHTIWKGDPAKGKYKALPNILYGYEDFDKIKGDFTIIDYIEYKELKDNDSFVLVLKK